MRPGSLSNMVKVNPEDILPMKKKESLLEMQRNRMSSKLKDETDRAGKRFVKVLIEPQKEIIREAMFESPTGKIDPNSVSNKISMLYNNVTDLRAQIGDEYDVKAAMAGVKQKGIDFPGDIDEFGELEVLRDMGKFGRKDTTIIIPDMDIASLVDDEDEDVYIAHKPAEPVITEDKEATYEIDPSLFDD